MEQTMEHARGGAGSGRLDREILVLGAVVVLGTIMSILDVTIVNVAIPTLGRDFDASISTIQWVMTGYMLAFASVIPLTGWATERLGAKRVWLTALVAFMAGSVLAGAAWSMGSLIAFRVLQGLGGGMILPVGQTILAQAAGPQRMGRVMSVIGVPMLLGPILGPVLGGLIIDQWSWRWIFFVNLPVGIVAVALAQRLLPEARPQLGQRLDLLGLALLSPGIVIFLYALAEAGNHGGFGDPARIVQALAGVALVVLFVWHAARRGSAALIDVSLFLRRGFATAAGTNFLVGIAIFGALILLPLYYQVVRHESPLSTGLLLVPQGAGAALAMPLAGWLTDAFGARVVVPVGVGLAMAGTAAYTQVGPSTSYSFLAVALFVIGMGLGASIVPSMAAAFQTLSHQAVPRATSALNAIQRIGGSIGTALLAIVLQRAIVAGVPGASDGIAGLAALPDAQREQAAPALADAFGTTFWVAFALLGSALVPAFLLPRVRRRVQATEAGDTADRSAA